MRPVSYGSICFKQSDNYGGALESVKKSGFNIIKSSNFSIKNDPNLYTEFIIKKNDLDKVASVVIYSYFSEDICPISLKKLNDDCENNYKYKYKDKTYRFGSKASLDKFSDNPEFYLNNKVAFICDIAKTSLERAQGLQPYNKLNYGSGLLFEYKRATDVLYYMGNVRYPIDILFIDKDNIIKKICKNIQPGSPAIFGCANVKNVLEIPGGISNHLGIYKGKYVDIKKGSLRPSIGSGIDNLLEKSVENNIKTFAKISSAYRLNSYNYKNNKIINLKEGDGVIRKKASSGGGLMSSLYGLSKDNISVSAFDLDSIGIHNPDNVIRLYSDSPDRSFIDVGVSGLISSDVLSLEYKVSKGYRKSFYNFISKDGVMPDYANSFFYNIVTASCVPDSKVIFVTRNKNSDDRLGEIVAKKIEDHFGIRSLSINYDILIVDEDEGRNGILNILKQKYGCLSPSLYIAKIAGMKVPEGTKKIADACISDIDSALSELDIIKNNFEHNISEYEKIQDDADLVRKTKGMYNQSSLRSKASVEKTLSKILSILKSMDGIKDVSTTSELIDGVVSSTKVYIDYVQNVFDVIEKFDDINFFGILSENTSAAISAIDDCKEALSRMENYVYNHILGVVPLSE